MRHKLKLEMSLDDVAEWFKASGAGYQSNFEAFPDGHCPRRFEPCHHRSFFFKQIFFL